MLMERRRPRLAKLMVYANSKTALANPRRPALARDSKEPAPWAGEGIRALLKRAGFQTTRHPALVVSGSFRELRSRVIVSKKMRRKTAQGMQRQTAGNLVHFFRRHFASATAIQYSVRHE